MVVAGASLPSSGGAAAGGGKEHEGRKKKWGEGGKGRLVSMAVVVDDDLWFINGTMPAIGNFLKSIAGVVNDGHLTSTWLDALVLSFF